MARVDWAKALDLARAVNNVRSEFVGDWHRDPWGWPELGYVLSREPAVVINHLNATGARRAALIDVPKENWGSRPAMVMDILDRLVYQALVDRLSVHLIGSLSASAFGWRLPPGSVNAGEYSQNKLQWNGYRTRLRMGATFFDVALVTDLVSCFASIELGLVRDVIDDRAPKGAVASRLFDLLEGFDRIPERSGLPQRSLASAVLANMVLTPLDDLLEHHARDLPQLVILGASKQRRSPSRSFARWMDDIWLFVDDAAPARRAQTELQDTARSLGLELNSAKTKVLEGDDVATEALQIEHSAVDTGLLIGDDQPLEELVDRILESPEIAGHTTLKFVSKRMRDHGSTYRVQELVAIAPRMPHAADALGPLFKKTFTSPSLQAWYLSYAQGDWAAFQWSLAHYARMFPSGRAPQRATRDFFAEVVADVETSLPLLAVAAQRLAAWDPTEARAVIRAALGKTSHPQPRRILAMAALGAGESRATIRRWLRQEDENDVTLRMLEYANFGPPKLVPEFAQ